MRRFYTISTHWHCGLISVALANNTINGFPQIIKKTQGGIRKEKNRFFYNSLFLPVGTLLPEIFFSFSSFSIGACASFFFFLSFSFLFFRFLSFFFFLLSRVPKERKCLIPWRVAKTSQRKRMKKSDQWLLFFQNPRPIRSSNHRLCLSPTRQYRWY